VETVQEPPRDHLMDTLNEGSLADFFQRFEVSTIPVDPNPYLNVLFFILVIFSVYLLIILLLDLLKKKINKHLF